MICCLCGVRLTKLRPLRYAPRQMSGRIAVAMVSLLIHCHGDVLFLR